jgi:hypothetical protein
MREFARNRGASVCVDDRCHDLDIPLEQLEVLMGTPIVPAERWSVISYYPAGESDGVAYDEGVHIEPIVAFVITSHGYLQPLVLVGGPVGDHTILRPDGKIEIVCGCTLNDVEEFKVEMRKQGELQ